MAYSAFTSTQDKEHEKHILAVVEARLGDRERAVAQRENKLYDARFDIEHLLDLLTDLGHPNVATRMRTRLERSGVL